jgi:hypothetical protein
MPGKGKRRIPLNAALASAVEPAAAAPILYGARNYSPGPSEQHGEVRCDPPLPGPAGPCPIVFSMAYAVYDRAGGTASDPWGIRPTEYGYPGGTSSVIDFTGFDTSARYLYLYEFGQDSAGLAINSALVTGGEPSAVTSAGPLPDTGFRYVLWPPEVVTGAVFATRPGRAGAAPNGTLFMDGLGLGENLISPLYAFTSNAPPAPGLLTALGSGESIQPPVRSRVTIRGRFGDVATAGMPEPGTVFLVGFGMAALGIRRRRERRSRLR